MLPVKFYGRKVLAIFRCGSYLHGVQSDASDRDYTVILKNYKDIRVEKQDQVDFFLFGIEPFKRATHFDLRILDYFLIWMDNTLLAKENLEYIDENFKNEFEQIINIDWEKYLTTWLRLNIQYFSACLAGLINEKSLYNLYRIRSLISHYEQTRKFTYFLDPEDKKLIIDYKNKKQNLERHHNNFISILAYLNDFLAKEEKR